MAPTRFMSSGLARKIDRNSCGDCPYMALVRGPDPPWIRFCGGSVFRRPLRQHPCGRRLADVSRGPKDHIHQGQHSL